MKAPNLLFEKEYLYLGYRTIAGVDEVGRGCLAGPVVAAAVVLNLEDIPPGINDSKKVRPKVREALDRAIRKSTAAVAIGMAGVVEIDQLNIFRASKLAMCRAIAKLIPQPDMLLIDGKFPIEYNLPQKCIISGDQKSVSIAAASIVAKVYRDAMMVQLDLTYPGYGFARHKGYGSKEHRKFLIEMGPSILHRKSFSWTPV